MILPGPLGTIVPSITIEFRVGSVDIDLTGNTPSSSGGSSLGPLARLLLSVLAPQLVIHTVAGDVGPIDLTGD